ncbi:MAG: PAS domain S-box protein [Candidatus Nanopelagicales bacterium]
MGGPTSRRDALDAILSDPAAQYRLLVEESSDVLTIHDPDGRMRWISPSIERMVGWTPEERMSGLVALVHPDDQPALDEVNRRLIAGADSGSARIRLLHKDGRHIWVTASARAWRDADGEIIALVIVTHDIDAMVRAEEERRDVEKLYRLIAENANDVVLETVDGTIRWVSPSVTPVLGWKPDQLVGRPAWEYMHPDDVRPVQADAERVHAGLAISGRARALAADGSYRWFARTQRPVHAADGTVLSHVTGLRDIHDQVLAEQALQDSEAHFRMVAESATHFSVQVDAHGVVLWASPSVRTVLGWEPEDIVGTVGTDYLHPEQQSLATPAKTRLRDGQVLAGRARFRRADGSYVWVSQVVTPLFDDAGAYVGSVSGFQDAEAEVHAEQALAASEERFRLVMAAAPAGMAVAGLDRRLLVVNPALCALLERDEEWLLAHTTLDVVHPDDLDTVLAVRSRLDAGDPVEPTEVRVLTGSDRTVWVQFGTAVLRDDQGEPNAVVVQLVDVTETRRVRERLRDLAEHDQLTGALHRSPLEDALELLLERAGSTGRAPGVLYVDVDGLGRMNNAYGHPAGDLLLTTVAARMRDELRVDDLLARFGGDEFVVVLPGVGSREDARHVAEKLRTAVCRDLDVEGHLVEPAISIGVALARPDDTVKRLLKRADQALYVAKAGGRNRTADDADL